MKHLLMDPAFPDLIADWAAKEQGEREYPAARPERREHLTDAFLHFLGKLEVASNRLW